MCTCMCMCISMCVYQITGLDFACGGVINRMGCIYTKKAGMDGWRSRWRTVDVRSYMHSIRCFDTR